MKIFKFFLIATFIISLLAGFSAGSLFFSKQNKAPEEQTTDDNYDTSMPGDQESIWFIAVDRLTVSKPKIAGIWLLAYIPNYTSMKPLSLYPSNDTQKDAELARAFKMTSDRKIDQDFWDYLKKHNHPSQDYIVFDEEAAVSIINIFGGVTLQGKRLSGLEALQQIPKTWDDPQGSLRGQVFIMDSICKSIFDKRVVPDMEILHKEIGKHISSNLDLSEKSREWQKLIANVNHNACDFSDMYQQTLLITHP
jgi:hypothetical protein